MGGGDVEDLELAHPCRRGLGQVRRRRQRWQNLLLLREGVCLQRVRRNGRQRGKGDRVLQDTNRDHDQVTDRSQISYSGTVHLKIPNLLKSLHNSDSFVICRVTTINVTRKGRV